MIKILKELIGSKVQKTFFEDLSQVDFESGARLIIYNPVDITSGDHSTLPNRENLKGAFLEGCSDSNGIAQFFFSGNVVVSVKFGEKGKEFAWPEALQLRVPGNPIIVWQND